MSTFGHPGRYTYCIGEHEEVSPWPPYHAGRGLTAADSAVTVFAGVPAMSIGLLAAQRLFAGAYEGNAPIAGSEALMPQLVVRESTGPAPP